MIRHLLYILKTDKKIKLKQDDIEKNRYIFETYTENKIRIKLLMK